MRNISDVRSHITILRPRDTSYGGSARITTDYLHNIARQQGNEWRNRKEFILTTLVLCLNLGCLWRFPKQLLLYGSGGFFWMYVVFTFLITNSLVFFEVALGQYSSKGFAKVFAMCPIFEGISYSMISYCLFASIFYNFINVTSFTYFYSSFFPVLPYQNCFQVTDNCQENSTNLTSTPEYLFFYHKILLLYGNDTTNAFTINWRNVGVVFFLWVLVCIAIIKGIKTIHWFPIVYCSFAYIILIIVLAATFMHDGALTGLQYMFWPGAKGLFNGNTWWRALEQSMLNLCVGMGPLITYGSFSRFQSPAHIDSFYLSCAVTLISILSGMVIFGAVGIVASESGQDVAQKIMEYKKYIAIDTGVIYSQLFARMPSTVKHLSAVLFFLLHCFAGWFSLISYIEVFNYALISNSKFQNNPYCRIIANIAICLVCVFIGSVLCIRGGHKYMESLDKYFITVSLTIILLFELVGVIYIYGVFDLCDDIEFMLGFYPNIYYQVCWICTPVVLMILLAYEFYDLSLQTFSTPDIVICSMILVFIVCPILIQMIYNAVLAYMSGQLSHILYPREAILDTSSDTPISLYAQSTNTSAPFNPLALMNL